MAAGQLGWGRQGSLLWAEEPRSSPGSAPHLLFPHPGAPLSTERGGPSQGSEKVRHLRILPKAKNCAPTGAVSAPNPWTSTHGLESDEAARDALAPLPAWCCRLCSCSLRGGQEQGSHCRFMSKWGVLSGLHFRKMVQARWKGEARLTVRTCHGCLSPMGQFPLPPAFGVLQDLVLGSCLSPVRIPSAPTLICSARHLLPPASAHMRPRAVPSLGLLVCVNSSSFQNSVAQPPQVPQTWLHH